jgi:hypothetical protein
MSWLSAFNASATFPAAASTVESPASVRGAIVPIQRERARGSWDVPH